MLHAVPGGGHAAHHVVLEVGAGPVLRGLPVLLDGVLHLRLPHGDGAAGQAVRQLARGQAGQQASVVTMRIVRMESLTDTNKAPVSSGVR